MFMCEVFQENGVEKRIEEKDVRKKTQETLSSMVQAAEEEPVGRPRKEKDAERQGGKVAEAHRGN